MKKIYTKITIFVIAINLIIPPHLFANTSSTSKILKSFISEDAYYNGFALSMADCVNPKNKKDSFTFSDKKITWSAAIKGGVGKYNTSDYVVYWYAPDGSLFEKQAPQKLFVDCAGLKSSLAIDKDKMTSKIGLWKIETAYKNDIIDNKYFYLIETGTREITQGDINSLEAKILKFRPKPIAKVQEEIKTMPVKKEEVIEQVKIKKPIPTVEPPAAVVSEIKKEPQIGQPTKVIGEEKVAIKQPQERFALKDIKNVWLDVHGSSTASGIEFKPELVERKLRGHLNDIGFKIVDKKENADAIVQCDVDIIGRAGMHPSRRVTISFRNPSSDFIIDLFVGDSDKMFGTGQSILVSTLLDHMMPLMIKKKYDSGEKIYRNVTVAEKSEFEKIVSSAPDYDLSTIFKKRVALQAIKNNEYKNIGLLILPIWGEKKPGFMKGSALLSWSFPDIVYSQDLNAPSENDNLAALPSNLDKPLDPKTTYLLSDFKKPVVTTTPIPLTNYYREDLRESIFIAFARALSDYRINLHEIQYERYYDDLISANVEEALKKIALDKPDLIGIFVAYYMPHGNWYNVIFAGNYRYEGVGHGLSLDFHVSYFAIENKIDRTDYFKANVKESNPERVTVSLNHISAGIEGEIRKFFKKKEASVNLRETIGDTNKESNRAYIGCKKAKLISNDGKTIMEVYPKEIVTIDSDLDNSYAVTIKGYLNKGTVDIKPDKAIFTKTSPILWDRIILKNRFDYSAGVPAYSMGKFMPNQIVKCNEIVSVEPVSKDYYEVTLNGIIDKSKIVLDTKIFEKMGEIRGQLIENDHPLKNADIKLQSHRYILRQKTSSDGTFKFTKVPPGEMFTMFLESGKEKERRYILLTGYKEKIMLEPGEKIDLGKVILEPTNIKDVTSLMARMKEVREDLSRFIGMPKIYIVAYLGSPKVKFTEDIWLYKYKDTNVHFIFAKDNLSSYTYSIKILAADDESTSSEDDSRLLEVPQL